MMHNDAMTFTFNAHDFHNNLNFVFIVILIVFLLNLLILYMFVQLLVCFCAFFKYTKQSRKYTKQRKIIKHNLHETNKAELRMKDNIRCKSYDKNWNHMTKI